MKISEIIDKLEAYHGPLEPERRTCDIVQYGDPIRSAQESCCLVAQQQRSFAKLLSWDAI